MSPESSTVAPVQVTVEYTDKGAHLVAWSSSSMVLLQHPSVSFARVLQINFTGFPQGSTVTSVNLRQNAFGLTDPEQIRYPASLDSSSPFSITPQLESDVPIPITETTEIGIAYTRILDGKVDPWALTLSGTVPGSENVATPWTTPDPQVINMPGG